MFYKIHKEELPLKLIIKSAILFQPCVALLIRYLFILFFNNQ